MILHEGACHCGAIAVEYHSEVPPAETPLRECQCNFCRMHQALAVSDPHGHLTFRETEAGLLNLYRFGLATSDFLVCKRCGAYAGAAMDAGDTKVGILNIRLLNNSREFTSVPTGMDYGAENTSERVDRRLAKWMPVSLVCDAGQNAQTKDSC